jgi:hypothetical protein
MTLTPALSQGEREADKTALTPTLSQEGEGARKTRAQLVKRYEYWTTYR